MPQAIASNGSLWRKISLDSIASTRSMTSSGNDSTPRPATPERYGQVAVPKWEFKLMDSSKIYAKGKRVTARVNLYLTLYLRTVRVTKWRRQKTEARVPLLDGNIRDSHPLWGNFSGENWSNFKSKQSQISKTKTRNGGNSPKTWDFRRPKRKFCMTWSPIWLNIFFKWVTQTTNYG